MGATHGKPSALVLSGSNGGSSKWRRRDREKQRLRLAAAAAVRQRQQQNSVLANLVTSYASEMNGSGKSQGKVLLQSAAVASGRRVLSQSSASILGLDREMSGATAASNKHRSATGGSNSNNTAFEWSSSSQSHSQRRSRSYEDDYEDSEELHGSDLYFGQDGDDGDDLYNVDGGGDYVDCLADETCDLCAHENSIAWQLKSQKRGTNTTDIDLNIVACNDGEDLVYDSSEACDLCARENSIIWQPRRSTGAAASSADVDDAGALGSSCSRRAYNLPIGKPLGPNDSDTTTIRFQRQQQQRRRRREHRQQVVASGAGEESHADGRVVLGSNSAVAAAAAAEDRRSTFRSQDRLVVAGSASTTSLARPPPRPPQRSSRAIASLSERSRAAHSSDHSHSNHNKSRRDRNIRHQQHTNLHLQRHSQPQHSFAEVEVGTETTIASKMSPPPPTATATSTNTDNNQQQSATDTLNSNSAKSIHSTTATTTTATTTTTAANSNTTMTQQTLTMTPAMAVKFNGPMARQQCGLALSQKQREKQNLLGLLPAAIQEQDLQSKAVLNYLDKCQDELSKYVFLRNLKDFNERLYYYTLTRNVEKLMPLVYTPTVGLACQRFSEIYQRPRGVFVTINDLGRVSSLLANWPERDVRVIVVTDGERILGLGDLGANGMGISIGKLSLYTALAGIPPENVLPITIDVGTNNEYNLQDPFYIGLRQKRVRGEKYDALLEEFMGAVVDRWGRSCLIQFEDFANSTAFNLLERYRNRYCTFNDDIQGTASVCLSGLISAAKEIGSRLADCSFLFYGAGEANLGTAHLLIMAMVEDGITKEEAKKRVWLVDSKGLVVTSRTDLSGHKQEFAQPVQHIKDLEAIVDFVRPTAIVGASAQGGSFNESICKKMAQFNKRPIIFALSNPTKMAECTAAQAYQWTSGKCVFASGSPFDPVEYDGKTYITGQGNNAYIFPGVGLAAIGAHTHTIPEETFLIAARALSDQVTSSDTSVGLVYPRLNRIREVTLGVAARVLEYFYAERLANYRPEPSDKREFLRQIQYQPRYELDEI